MPKIMHIFKNKSNLILEIQTLVARLTNKGFRISFAWIPAHCGIQGNEKADVLAKEALFRPNIQMKLNLNQKEHRNISKRYHLDQWQFQWNNSSKGRPLHYLQPSIRGIDPVTGLCRRDEVVVHRLRFAKVKLGEYLHAINKRPHDRCLTCNNIDNAGHYLLACRRFDRERNELKRSLGVKDLSIKLILKPQNAHLLITYVKNTKMYYAL